MMHTVNNRRHSRLNIHAYQAISRAGAPRNAARFWDDDSQEDEGDYESPLDDFDEAALFGQVVRVVVAHGEPAVSGGVSGGELVTAEALGAAAGGEGVSGRVPRGPATPAPTGEMFFECNGPLFKGPRLKIIREASIRLSDCVG